MYIRYIIRCPGQKEIFVFKTQVKIHQEAGHTPGTSLMLIFWVSLNIHALIHKTLLKQNCSLMVSTLYALFQLDWKK